MSGAFATESTDFFGASLASYLIPSARQPLAEQFLASDAWPPAHVGDAVVFFGYSTIALAIVGLVVAVRRRGKPDAEPHRAFAVLFAAALLPLALVTSLPPHVSVGGFEIPTPSALLGHITTAWRIYSRFGVLVGLALVILAAYALRALISGHGRRGSWVAVGLMAVAAFELAPGPPVPTWSAVPEPAFVAWLADRPGGIVAHYPQRVRTPERGTRAWVEHSESSSYFQTRHGHPIFAIDEGFAGTRAESVRLLAEALHETVANALLAAEGVRYVLVHDDVYRAIREEPPVPAASEYRFVTELDGVRIFSLRDKPRATSVDDIVDASVGLLASLQGLSVELGSKGFHQVEPSGWRWLDQDGVIAVANESTADSFRIRFQGFTNRRPRTLELRAPDGTILDTADVLTSTTDVELGPFPLPRGRIELRLHATPGPERFEGPDRRITSVHISPPMIEAVASTR